MFLLLSLFRHDYRVILFSSRLWPCLMFMLREIVYIQQETTASRLACQASLSRQELSVSSREGTGSCHFLPLWC